MNIRHYYSCLAALCLMLACRVQDVSGQILQAPDQWDFSSLLNDTSDAHPLPNTLEGWTRHLELFGRHIPQEEVFVHMDNTCYFVGDTLYYKAYVRRSDNQRLTDLSCLLYAELWNQDGYLMERQLVRLENGQGAGSFVLSDSLYAGFYELRAYTRWQLNWGEFQHPHTWPAERFFITKKMAKEYYRDYEKLYSRIFPLYDKPHSPGEYNHDMTARPMFRYFRTDEKKPAPVATFYPEGGVAVKNTQVRLAFEANEQDGEHIDGTMRITDRKGNLVAQACTENRGRGTVEFFWRDGESYKALFTSDAGEEIKPRMPEAVADGCAVRAEALGDKLRLDFQPRGEAASETLGLTIMTGGALRLFRKMAATDTLLILPTKSLPTGVAQVTVFNALGRVYSDRLVFIRHERDVKNAAVEFADVRNIYEPFDSACLRIANPNAAGTTVSVAVRDAAYSQYLWDSSNMLTEMLLCSQIKGFVEHPDYYFEQDDSLHRRHLDLLLMVQGWRRHNWINMATPGIFRINHPIEVTPVYYGTVSRYDALGREGLYGWGLSDFQRRERYDFSKPGGGVDMFFWNNTTPRSSGAIPTLGWAKQARDQHNAYSYLSPDPNPESVDGQNYYSPGRVKREVRVHAEFLKKDEGGLSAMTGDVETRDGRFVLQMPSFYNTCILNLAASDTTKWDTKYIRRLRKKNARRLAKGKPVKSVGHEWVLPDEREYPEFYVRLTPYYPRFVKPFSFYHTHVAPPREGTALAPELQGTRVLDEITVRSRHGGLRAVNANSPVFTRDAYEVFNECVDAGFSPGWFAGPNHFIQWIQRLYVGDMNLFGERNNDVNFSDGIKTAWSAPSFGNSWSNPHNYYTPGNLAWRNSAGRDYRLDDPADVHGDLLNPHTSRGYYIPWTSSVRAGHSYTGYAQADLKMFSLKSLHKVSLITDYCPRLEGSQRYWGANRPSVGVNLISFSDGVRMTFRDRHYVVQGYNVCEDFYQPNYRNRPLPEVKDYRRTLYWNPFLELDGKGRASVSFWNNGKPTAVTVSVEGISPSGQIVTGISYPEDR